jgi:hypothetical protein
MSRVLVVALNIPILAAMVTAAEGQAMVRVHVTDAVGDAIEAPRIEISGGTRRLQVKQDEVVTLPYGAYSVRVLVPGFEPAEVSARIDQSDQVVLIGLRVGAIDAPVPTCSVTGRIAPQAGAMRLRLVQLFGDYLTDIAPGPGGLFEFRNLQCGDYLLVVMGSQTCLATRVVRAQMAPQPIDLRLPGRPSGSACDAPTR